jgi:acyl-CoA synthetase (AMP-forming)/AMP-acid ligase II
MSTTNHTESDGMPEPVANEGASVNIASYLSRAARERPYKRAVVCPSGRDSNGRVAYAHLTFQQLDRESDRIAHGLLCAGIGRGTRTILMVRPSLEFFELIFAIFKIGAVPVVVDPGMGIRRMLACYRSTRPQAFIGVPIAHAVRTFLPQHFDTVRVWVTVGRRWFWRGLTLKKIRAAAWQPLEPAPTGRDDPAAILFTTGSTGPAKGALYTHGNFDAQLQQIASHLDFAPDEVDLSTFPLFALFYPALGVTAVVPEMDPTRPARANPERLIEAILDQGVTNMFASPALLDRLGSYGRARGVRLPSLKRVISAGAPVQARTIELFQPLLAEGAEIHTPYGATEAVPIASILGAEILSETSALTDKGYGICVGRPLDGTPIRIIAVSDDPIRRWTEELPVPQGEIGEIVVRGDLVSRGYFENPLADSLAKIPDGGGFWHRMGDLGWMDRKGRIWFCGRKSHRVTTAGGPLYTVPCESIFNTHPLVYRSALVGIGPPNHQAPAICIELKKTKKGINRKTVRMELLHLASQHEITREIKIILFRDSFPVDIRHNAKIFREQLADWAARKARPAVKPTAARRGRGAGDRR